jgi:hypothetical protein
LFNVALELDSRNVVATDLDADGRVDLLLTHYEPWPQPKQTIRIYKNLVESQSNWIGFRFRESGGQSPIGTSVTVRYGHRASIRQLMTGDSHRSQHPAALHFGLGPDQVESVEIRWPDGKTFHLRQPEVNRYHWIDRKLEPPSNPTPRPRGAAQAESGAFYR